MMNIDSRAITLTCGRVSVQAHPARAQGPSRPRRKFLRVALMRRPGADVGAFAGSTKAYCAAHQNCEADHLSWVTPPSDLVAVALGCAHVRELAYEDCMVQGMRRGDNQEDYAINRIAKGQRQHQEDPSNGRWSLDRELAQ